MRTEMTRSGPFLPVYGIRCPCCASIIRNTFRSLYTDTLYNDKTRYNDNTADMKHSLKLTVYLKLCKNIVFNTSSNICVDICLNYLSEAILTHIQNIVIFYEEIILR